MLAISTGVFQKIVLVPEHLEGLVFNLPSRPSGTHDLLGVLRGDLQLADSLSVWLEALLDDLMALQEIVHQIRVALVQRYAYGLGDVLVPYQSRFFPIPHTTPVAGRASCADAVCRRFSVRDKFGNSDEIHAVLKQRCQGWAIGNQSNFEHNEAALKVLLGDAGDQPLTRIAFAIVLVRAILHG